MLFYGVYPSDALLTPPDILGAPVRVGDRVYLLTSQWKTTIPIEDLYPRTTDLLVDLWSFDALTAKPLWRSRLQQERSGTNMGRSILGIEGETIWVLLPRGIAAVSTRDGSFQARSARIEQLNPPLRGLLPKESRYYEFGANGLRFTAADGTEWRLEPGSFLAQPATSARPPTQPATLPARFIINMPYTFLKRGLLIPGHWLGLLTDEEAKRFEQQNSMAPELNGDVRRRLWGARTG